MWNENEKEIIMATFKKSKLKRAQDGISADYKERQGNYPKESQAGKGPSSDYKERQGQKAETKSPPNKFPEAKAPETKKTETFSQAFAAARKAGDKTFKWNGKSYTTQTKEEAAKPAAKSKVEAVPEKGNESKRKVLPEVEVIGKKPAPKTAKAASSKPSPLSRIRVGVGPMGGFKKGGKVSKKK